MNDKCLKIDAEQNERKTIPNGSHWDPQMKQRLNNTVHGGNYAPLELLPFSMAFERPSPPNNIEGLKLRWRVTWSAGGNYAPPAKNTPQCYLRGEGRDHETDARQ